MLVKNKGECIIDECDSYLLKENWCASKNKGKKFNKYTTYAARRVLVDGKSTNIYLHRVIMDAKKGQFVNHINGNGLDNRRCNLEIVTQSTNCSKARIYSNNTTGFKGVYFNKITNKYFASLMVHRKSKFLGSYRTIEEAVAARKAGDEKFKEEREKKGDNQ